MPRVIDFDQIESNQIQNTDFVPLVRPGEDLIVQVQNLREKILSTHLAEADPHSQYALKTNLSAIATSGNWSDIIGKPSTFAPSAHSHSYEAAGAVAAHAALSDPHTQYALESSLSAVAISGSYNDLINLPSTVSVAPGISGLQVSSVTVNEITVSPGWCSVNVNGALRVVNLSSSLTKSIASNWVAGNNQGGLASGSRASNSTYWIHLIFNPSTNAVDILFSASITASDRPVGWFAQPILPFTTESANSNIRLFTQLGDRVTYGTQVLALDTASLSTSSGNLVAIPVPTGIPLLMHGVLQGGTTGESAGQFLSNGRLVFRNEATASTSTHIELETNSSAQVSLYAIASGKSARLFASGIIYDRRSRIGV